MKKVLIGEKEIFAIEFGVQLEFSKGMPYGGCLLWLNGIPYGDFDDPVFLKSIAEALTATTRYVEKLVLDGSKIPKNVEELEILLMEDESIPSTHNFFMIEGFDDFLALIHFKDQVVHIVWALRKCYVDLVRYTGYPKGLLHAEIPYGYFKERIFEFNRALSQEAA